MTNTMTRQTYGPAGIPPAFRFSNDDTPGQRTHGCHQGHSDTQGAGSRNGSMDVPAPDTFARTTRRPAHGRGLNLPGRRNVIMPSSLILLIVACPKPGRPHMATTRSQSRFLSPSAPSGSNAIRLRAGYEPSLRNGRQVHHAWQASLRLPARNYRPLHKPPASGRPLGVAPLHPATGSKQQQ